MAADVSGKTYVGEREQNEDRILAKLFREDDSALLAVADGLGGEVAGEVASSEAVGTLEAFVESHRSMPPDELLNHAFDAANAAVRNTSRRRRERTRSTLVAALVRERAMWVAAVGDSRAYLVNETGWTQITTDHTWAEEEIHSGLLARGDAAASPSRNMLTRSLGSKDVLAVDVFGPIAFADEDTLVLCSDGLYSVIDAEEIAGIVRAHRSEPAAEALIGLAKSRRAQDNVSVVVYKAA